jgi:SAM-dependent methyltransferase
MKNKNLSRSYDAIYYAEIIKLFDFSSRFPQRRDEALYYLSREFNGKRVLEIGCGGGNALYNLRNHYTELYGVELSEKRCEHLQTAFSMANVTITILNENIESGLSLPNGYFDLIIWADVIEHVVDVWAAMEEIRRLLAANGKLVTLTPNIAEFRRRLTLLFGCFPSTSGTNEGLTVRENELFDGGHLHYFTFSSLSKLYLKYGIKPIKSFGFGNLGYLHNLYPPLLSGSVGIVGIKLN